MDNINNRCLAILAHPDDAELRCYGTLRKIVSQNNICKLIIMSSGEHGIFLEETKECNIPLSTDKREKETINSFNNTGIDIMFLSQKDGYIEYSRDLICIIEKEMKSFKPTCLITHYPDIYGIDHQDHTATAKTVLNCATRVESIRKILLCEPLKSIRSNFMPNYYVDITQYFDDKLKALEYQVSQKGRYYMSEEFQISKSNFYASNIAYSLAKQQSRFEAFQLHLYCEE